MYYNFSRPAIRDMEQLPMYKHMWSYIYFEIAVAGEDKTQHKHAC